MLPIGSIVRHHDIDFHIFGNDTQLYVSFDLSNPNVALDLMNVCISDLRIWMIRNQLKINDLKIEFLIITSSFLKQSYDDLNIMVGDSNIVSSNSAHNLGMIFNKYIKLDYHISSVCKSTYFHLRNIGGIRNILSNDTYAQLIHSLVTVRLDYCNSIMYGLPDNSLYRLQKIQNTAARILARLPRFYHISATLVDLHWLPIRYRITFKMCILTYQAYHRTAPSYLCDLIVPYFNTRSLRSNDKCLIKPCNPRLRSYGERCFKYAGPQEWNKLPIYIRKAHLFPFLKPN